MTVLINNAGSAPGADLLTGDLADIRREMDTHYLGTLSVIRAFAPQIAANGGGAILNVLSGLSWVSFPAAGAYCAAKSAEWSLTNALRLQLAGQGIRVTALHIGYMDTDMIRTVDAPKSDPATSPGSPSTASPTTPTRSSRTTPPARRRPHWPAVFRCSTRSFPERDSRLWRTEGSPRVPAGGSDLFGIAPAVTISPFEPASSLQLVDAAASPAAGPRAERPDTPREHHMFRLPTGGKFVE